jgi:hypothetical protein
MLAAGGLKYNRFHTTALCSPTRQALLTGRNHHSVETRSMVQTDEQFPNVGSHTEGLLVNADGSVDIYFGPTAPAGKEKNWVQTIPGKGWNTLYRLFSPLEPWFDKSWRPGEIERQA